MSKTIKCFLLLAVLALTNMITAKTLLAARVMVVYMNYYVMPKTTLGMNYYLDLFKRGGVNRVAFPYDIGPRPDDNTCKKFIALLQANDIQVMGWYHAQNVPINDPKPYFTNMFNRFPSLDGVTADDGYELFVGRWSAIQADPTLIPKGIAIAANVYSAIKSIKSGAIVSASSTESIDAAPIGIACIKNGTLDYIEPEVYHPVTGDPTLIIQARKDRTQMWIDAVGSENAGKLVMLINNYQSTYANPAKSALIVFTEITAFKDTNPNVGTGIFALAWLTDEQMDALGNNKPFDGQLPDYLKRTPEKINVLIHGRIGSGRITDFINGSSAWLDMWNSGNLALKLTTFPLINDELLAQVDIYITSPPGYYGLYTQAEKDALTRFVNGGGRVLWLASMAGESAASVQMLSNFGMTVYWYIPQIASPFTYTKTTVHPIADNITTLSGGSGWVENITVTGSAIPIFTAVAPDGNTTLVEVAAWRQGSSSGGRIAVIASGIGRANESLVNIQLTNNLISWFSDGLKTIDGSQYQMITFTNPGNKNITDKVTLTATASSGLPVSFAVASGPAQITDGILSFYGTGSVSIVATQSGNANFVAATPVTNMFTVSKFTTVQSLVANWSFDEGTGTTAGDSSGNGYTGNIVNGASWADGKIGNALSFDGVDDYIQLPNVGISTGSFSIEGWVNPKINEFPTMYGTFVGYNNNRRILIYGGSSGQLLAQMGNNFFSKGYLKSNVWSHIVYVYNITENKEYFYINGAYDSSQAVSNPTWNDVFRIGECGGGTFRFKGSIDEVRIYNCALSSSQILSEYQNDIAVTPPSVITTLTAGSPTANSITLSWSAPGNDGTVGTATVYDIRYYTVPITAGNWSLANQVTGEPTPQVSGTNQSYTVEGLSPNTTYYFGIKTSDEKPNWSNLSNISSNTTTSDITPPIVNAVSVTDIMTNSAVITWTTDEPSDSQVEYGLTTSLGSTTTLNTTLVTTHSVLLGELEKGKTYYYKVFSKDTVGNLTTSAQYSFKTYNNNLRHRIYTYYYDDTTTPASLKFWLQVYNLDANSIVTDYTGTVTLKTKNSKGEELNIVDTTLTETDAGEKEVSIPLGNNINTIELTGDVTAPIVVNFNEMYTAKLVGYQGGTIRGADGLKILIPTGVLSANKYLASIRTSASPAVRNTMKYVNTINPICYDFGELTFGTGNAPVLENQVFTRAVNITIPYTKADIGTLNEDGLRIYYWTGTDWELVPGVQAIDKTNKTITATVKHFSTYRILGSYLSADFSNLKVYPNPYNPATAIGGKLKIINLPVSSVVKLYSVTGELVRELKEIDFGNLGWLEWDGKNDDGDKVGKAVYIYQIEDAAGKKKTGKIGLVK
ncbi:MAG: fibronectin type III domain-containing protein [Elusimicrobia bacterium]|nr:fibronectin type III domain-containing protein [Elusimicrobiota bacterium]